MLSVPISLVSESNISSSKMSLASSNVLYKISRSFTIVLYQKPYTIKYPYLLITSPSHNYLYFQLQLTIAVVKVTIDLWLTLNIFESIVVSVI